MGGLVSFYAACENWGEGGEVAVLVEIDTAVGEFAEGSLLLEF